MLKKRMRKKKKLLSSDEEIDPMIYAVNMIDCMLVLAVGFLIFTIIFMNTSPQEVKQPVQIKEMNNTTFQNATQSTGASGLTDVGTVYKDPKTGKLILVENT
jgi:hypothetical protein